MNKEQKPTQTTDPAIAVEPVLAPVLFSQEEIEKYYVRCEFDDTCDVCDDPQHGSYAVGYVNDMCGCEVDYYICGKCASLAIPKLIEEEKKLDEYIRSLNGC